MKVSKIQQPSFFEFTIFCPGCKCGHGFRTANCIEPDGLNDDDKDLFKNKWTWNGDFENPTINPSLNVLHKIGTNNGKAVYETRCHSFVKDGKIQFLGDCKHGMANQTIDLPEW